MSTKQTPLSLFKEADRYDAAAARLESKILVYRYLAERTREEAATMAIAASEQQAKPEK